MVQTGCGRSVASKLRPQQAAKVFLRADTEISEKRNFFVNRSVPENFQPQNFFGSSSHGILTPHNSINLYERGVLQIFDPFLVVPSRVRATKCDPLAKGVQKNRQD